MIEKPYQRKQVQRKQVQAEIFGDEWMDGWIDGDSLDFLRTGTVTSSLFFMYQFYLKQK